MHETIGILHPGAMGISVAAAEVYTRLDDFKEQEEAPGLTAVLQALLRQ